MGLSITRVIAPLARDFREENYKFIVVIASFCRESKTDVNLGRQTSSSFFSSIALCLINKGGEKQKGKFAFIKWKNLQRSAITLEGKVLSGLCYGNFKFNFPRASMFDVEANYYFRKWFFSLHNFALKNFSW